MVHSGLMRGERYEMAENFEEDWMCPAVTWSAGGEETYRFRDGGTIGISPAGALCLSAEARYAYAAGQTPFYSNMIVFPHWMTRGAVSPILDRVPNERRLQTQLIAPDAAAQNLMNEIALSCRRGFTNVDWYQEKLALLYEALLAAQERGDRASERIGAVKKTTRIELARRARRAQQFILENYADPTIGLREIAREACLSPYHLIRVFKDHAGQPPIQYLTAVRMEMAASLLRETGMTTTEVGQSVGYGDRTAFFRAFRKSHGAAPSTVARLRG